MTESVLQERSYFGAAPASNFCFLNFKILILFRVKKSKIKLIFLIKNQ